MPGYKLSRKALRDVAEILTHLHKNVSSTAADRAESKLFRAFGELGTMPGIGHRRADLTQKDVFFYASKPYILIFRRGSDGAHIAHVMHDRSDLAKVV